MALVELSAHVFWEIARRLSPQDQLHLRSALPGSCERLRRLCVVSRGLRGRVAGWRPLPGGLRVAWSELGEVAVLSSESDELRDWRTWEPGAITSVVAHALSRSGVVFVAGRRRLEVFRVDPFCGLLRSVGLWRLPRGLQLVQRTWGCGTADGTALAFALPALLRGSEPRLLCLVAGVDGAPNRTELHPWPGDGEDWHCPVVPRDQPLLAGCGPFMLWPEVAPLASDDGSFLAWDRRCDHVTVFWGREQRRRVHWLDGPALAANDRGIVVTCTRVFCIARDREAVAVELPVPAAAVLRIVGAAWVAFVAAQSQAVCLFSLETHQLAELPFLASSVTQTLYFESANALLVRTTDCARLVSLKTMTTAQLAVRTRLPPQAAAAAAAAPLAATRDAAMLRGDNGYVWFGCTRGTAEQPTPVVRWCVVEDLAAQPLALLGPCADPAASPLFFLFRRGHSRLLAPVFPTSAAAMAAPPEEEPAIAPVEPFAARLAQLEASARRLARALSALSSGVDEDGAELKGNIAWDELWLPPRLAWRSAAAIDERWYVLVDTGGHLWIVAPYECKVRRGSLVSLVCADISKAVLVPQSGQRKPGRGLRVLRGAGGLLVLWQGTRVHVTREALVRAALDSEGTLAPELRCRRLLLPGGAREVSLVRPHFLVATMQNRVAVWDLTSVEPHRLMDLSKH